MALLSSKNKTYSRKRDAAWFTVRNKCQSHQHIWEHGKKAFSSHELACLTEEKTRTRKVRHWRKAESINQCMHLPGRMHSSQATGAAMACNPHHLPRDGIARCTATALHIPVCTRARVPRLLDRTWTGTFNTCLFPFSTNNTSSLPFLTDTVLSWNYSPVWTPGTIRLFKINVYS